MSERNFEVGRIKWDNGEKLWLCSTENGQTITRSLELVKFLNSIEKRPRRKAILQTAVDMMENGIIGRIN